MKIKFSFEFLIVTLIAILACLIPSSAISQSDFKVAFVTFVHDYNKYVTRDNVYRPGEDLKLYMGVENVNRGRAAAVDFMIVVKDPNDYTVYGKVVKKRVIGYEDRIYDTLSLKVEDEWIEGKYKIEAYVFDVLNFSETYKKYKDIYNKFIHGKTETYSVSIETISRDIAPYVRKELTFYVKKYRSLPNQFIIFNPRLEASRLPAGAPNVLKVNVMNRLDVEGETTIRVLVNGEVVDDKTVKLSGYEIKEVSFEIPPLPIGRHLIRLRAENSLISGVLPIVVKPLIYNKPILVGDVLNGTLIYSPNNYILGSVGISEIKDVEVEKAIKNLKSPNLNRESARKMLTNLLAHIFLNNKNKKTNVMRIALLKGSDERAEKILPKLLEVIRKESGAPILYKGVKDYNELFDVDIVFYVGGKPKVERLRYFFENGGTLIVDNPFYWRDLKHDLELNLLAIGGWKNVSTPKRLFYSFYQLDVYRGMWVTVMKEMKLPPKITYHNLSVDKFITGVGEPVRISFSVKNEGQTGEVKVKVLVNGKTAYEKKIILKTGEERLISFEYTPMEEGSYKVEIPGTVLVKVFFAKAKAPMTPTPTTPVPEKREGAIFIIISAVILAALIIVRILIRD